jgi:cytochrome c-type biogenesis protein
MDNYFLGMGTAIWLGVLTSISPCPLATNITAISFIGRQMKSGYAVLLAGLFYTLGRTVTYVVFGFILVSSSHMVPRISIFLQTKMSIILGPVLIVVGIFLVDIFKFSFGGKILSDKMQKKLALYGWGGAFALGVLFAISFCPVSAALFFGNIFGLALQHSSRLVIPGLYGIGTAMPVFAFALIIAFSANTIGVIYNKITVIEKWARKISGFIFLGVGLYMTLYQTFHLF